MDTIVLNRVLKCDEALRKIDRSDWHELKAKMLSPEGEKILTGLQIYVHLYDTFVETECVEKQERTERAMEIVEKKLYFLISGRYTDVIKW